MRSWTVKERRVMSAALQADIQWQFNKTAATMQEVYPLSVRHHGARHNPRSQAVVVAGTSRCSLFLLLCLFYALPQPCRDSAVQAVDMGTKAKDEGNKCYKARAFDKAVAYYRTGLAKLRSAKARKVIGFDGPIAAGPGQSAMGAALSLEVSLHMNVAMCLVKQAAWEEAISSCAAALRLDPSSAKARLYRARALAASPHRDRVAGLEAARADLLLAAAASPKDKVVAQELRSVEARLGLAPAPPLAATDPAAMSGGGGSGVGARGAGGSGGAAEADDEEGRQLSG